MTTTGSRPSGSEADSSAFESYDERIQRFIWLKQWPALREVQERAAAPVLAADCDVVIAAATAGGKTEAVMFPALTRILAQPASGLRLLVISPLKALINDQFERLEEMCGSLELPVHRWHGDVAGDRKRRVLDGEGGVLLITPESLEAMLILNGPKAAKLFGDLEYLLVDELHAFIGTERGKQLQSLMHRTELAARRRLPRLALSATLGDMAMAAEFLRPGHGDGVTIVESSANPHAVALQIRAYLESDPMLDDQQIKAMARDGHEAALEQILEGHTVEIGDDLWRLLRGGRHLAFCNARRRVEEYCDLLRERADQLRVPNEFWPHHGSLSKQLREDAEAALKDQTRPATIVATSTLELGIDVGAVETIAQIEAPYSVASTRQRLGRSGRAEDAASMLRIFVAENEITPDTPPQDTLRGDLVQSIAVVNLLIEGFNEPPDPEALHLSTLVQQTLSLIAQHGGVTAADAWQSLCRAGAFAAVGQQLYASFLRSLGNNDLIVQTHDGLLVLGLTGERLINHYEFYAAFAAAQEYRLVTGATTLGTVPADVPLIEETHLIFGGRRWVILEVDTERKVVEVAPSPGGRAPSFGGGRPWVHDRVRAKMRAVYLGTDVPAFLNAAGRELLDESRIWFHRHGLDTRTALRHGDQVLLFPWVGDRSLTTLMLQLVSEGAEVADEGPAIAVSGTTTDARRRLEAIWVGGALDAAELASRLENLEVEKHHRWLDRDLLIEDYASARLDTVGAHRASAAVLEGWPR